MSSNRLLTQGVWIEGGVTSFNLATLMEPGQLGMFFEKDGKKYQLVQRDANDASTTAFAAGAVVAWVDRALFTVTADISTTKRNDVAGVALESATVSHYTWIQVRGNYATVKTNGDDDIADGDLIIFSTADGVVDSVAAGTAPTYIPLGIASAADVDANNTVAVDLFPPLNGA